MSVRPVWGRPRTPIGLAQGSRAHPMIPRGALAKLGDASCVLAEGGRREPPRGFSYVSSFSGSRHIAPSHALLADRRCLLPSLALFGPPLIAAAGRLGSPPSNVGPARALQPSPSPPLRSYRRPTPLPHRATPAPIPFSKSPFGPADRLSCLVTLSALRTDPTSL